MTFSAHTACSKLFPTSSLAPVRHIAHTFPSITLLRVTSLLRCQPCLVSRAHSWHLMFMLSSQSEPSLPQAGRRVLCSSSKMDTACCHASGESDDRVQMIFGLGAHAPVSIMACRHLIIHDVKPGLLIKLLKVRYRSPHEKMCFLRPGPMLADMFIGRPCADHSTCPICAS